MKIILLSLFISLSAFSFTVFLDEEWKNDKVDCVSVINKNGELKQKFQGCCSHHGGIAQCKPDYVIYFVKDNRLMCGDKWKSSCKLKK